MCLLLRMPLRNSHSRHAFLNRFPPGLECLPAADILPVSNYDAFIRYTTSFLISQYNLSLTVHCREYPHLHHVYFQDLFIIPNSCSVERKEAAPSLAKFNVEKGRVEEKDGKRGRDSGGSRSGGGISIPTGSTVASVDGNLVKSSDERVRAPHL